MSDKDPEKERKERVIHTRVPESLDDELRRRANSLGMSVSNLVRNALNHAFGLVEDVISDSASVARSARGEAEARAAAGDDDAMTPLDGVIGWQTVLIHKQMPCARCDTPLERGSEALLAVTEHPGPRWVIHPRHLDDKTDDKD